MTFWTSSQGALLDVVPRGTVKKWAGIAMISRPYFIQSVHLYASSGGSRKLKPPHSQNTIPL